jgi:hypothetical protein
VNRNLEPGQYQIGNFIFGRYTLFTVEKFEVGGYDVNVQDFQVVASDETRFGSDSLKGLPIQLTINALVNKLLPNVAALQKNVPDLVFDDPRVGSFAREWRADEVRKKWGELKPLLYCRSDGKTLVIYGRPGKLAIGKRSSISDMHPIVAEFRRSDTFCYTDFEWYVNCPPFIPEHGVESKVVIYRSEDLGHGDAPCWLRFLLLGPMTHPIIQLGHLTIELNHELVPGEVVEISSYPWQRRCIRLNDGRSLNSKLVRPYLDKLNFPTDSYIELSWTATDIDTTKYETDFTVEGIDPNVWEPIKYEGPGTGKIEMRDAFSGGLSPVAIRVLGYTQLGVGGGDWVLGQMFTKASTLTDYQSVKFQMLDPGENPAIWELPANRIIGRCNSDASEYVYWDVTYRNLQYGIHYAGQDWPLTGHIDFHHIIMQLKLVFGELLIGNIFGALVLPGWDWEYEAWFGTGAGLKTSTLLINGTPIYTFEGSIYDNSFADATHRRTGLGMRATKGGVAQNRPGSLTMISTRDNVPPDVDIEIPGVSQVMMMWRDAWQVIE